MEIVLLEDAKALGEKGQIIKVNGGYARNSILSKKLGVGATPKNLNDSKLQKVNTDKIVAEQSAMVKELGEKLEKSPVILSIKAGENGRAFGSVSSKKTGKAITEQLRLDINKKRLVLSEPLKTFGIHEMPVKPHKDVIAKLAVKVVEAQEA